MPIFQRVLQVPGGEVEPLREVRGGQQRDDGEGELERRAEGRQGGRRGRGEEQRWRRRGEDNCGAGMDAAAIIYRARRDTMFLIWL